MPPSQAGCSCWAKRTARFRCGTPVWAQRAGVHSWRRVLRKRTRRGSGRCCPSQLVSWQFWFWGALSAAMGMVVSCSRSVYKAPNNVDWVLLIILSIPHHSTPPPHPPPPSNKTDTDAALPHHIATASSDGVVKLWDCRKFGSSGGGGCTELASVATNARITCMVLSAPGRRQPAVAGLEPQPAQQQQPKKQKASAGGEQQQQQQQHRKKTAAKLTQQQQQQEEAAKPKPQQPKALTPRKQQQHKVKAHAAAGSGDDEALVPRVRTVIKKRKARGAGAGAGAAAAAGVGGAGGGVISIVNRKAPRGGRVWCCVGGGGLVVQLWGLLQPCNHQTGAGWCQGGFIAWPPLIQEQQLLNSVPCQSAAPMLKRLYPAANSTPANSLQLRTCVHTTV